MPNNEEEKQKERVVENVSALSILQDAQKKPTIENIFNAQQWKSFPRQTAIRARLSGNQTIGDMSSTTLSFATEDFDVLGEFDNTTYTFTPKSSGYFMISASVWYTTASVANKIYDIEVYKGATRILINRQHGDGVVQVIPHVSGCVELTTTDAVTVKTYQNSGANATASSNSEGTFATIFRIC